MPSLSEQIQTAVQFIKQKTDIEPSVALILGSGLGDVAEQIDPVTAINYSDIPFFPTSTVEGHAGKLCLGTLFGKNVVVMQGRFHYYEGFSMQEVTFPVRVMKALGAKILLVTNACGGLNEAFQAGDLMLIQDHLNLTGDNPLIGPNDETLGPRFPDMSNAYDKQLRTFVTQVAKQLNIRLQAGIYGGISGPNYMTRSELNMLRTLGADAVGMSTVPEVIVANHAGMRVIGLSCITDMAIPEELEPLTHEEVINVANQTKPVFISLVKEVITKLPQDER